MTGQQAATRGRGFRRERPGQCGRWALAVLIAVLWTLAPGPGEVQARQNGAAHQQFLFAYKLLQRGDNDLAADAFDDYLGKFPRADKVNDAKYYRALLYRRAGNNAQAAKLLAHAGETKLAPAYAVKLLRGQVLSDLGSYKAAAAVLKRIDTASLKGGVKASVFYLRGLAQRGAGALPAAEAQLKAAAEVDSPMRGRALLDLARVQLLMKHRDQAVATLGRTIKRGGSAAAEAARVAGDIRYNQKRYDQAVGFYQRVVRQHETSGQFGPAVVGVLRARYAAGRYQAVLDAFKRHRAALAVQDRAPAWYFAGSAEQKMGHHEQAAGLFKQIAGGEGRYPLKEKVLYKLASSQLQLGRYDAMRRTVGRLSTQYPKSDVVIDAAFLLASADAAQGRLDRGVARLTRLIRQGSDNPFYLPALLHRARLYEKHHKLKLAAKDYLDYLKQSDYQPVGRGADGSPISRANQPQLDAFMHLLDVYQRLGAYAFAAGLARQWLDHIKLPPDVRRETRYRRAVSLIRLNRPQDALALLNRLAQSDGEADGDGNGNVHGSGSGSGDGQVSGDGNGGGNGAGGAFAGRVSYYRGLLLLSMNDGGRGATLLEHAAADHDLARPMRINALRLLGLRARENDQPGQAVRALRRIEKLASRKKLTDEELIWMSRHLLTRGEAKSALAYVRLLVTDRPEAKPATRSEALYLAGRAQRAQDRPDQATKLFHRVVALGHGFDLEARLELARVSVDRGDYDQAMAGLSGLMSSESSQIAAQALFVGAQVQRKLAARARRAENHQAMLTADRRARKLLKRLVLLYPFKQVEPLPQLSYLKLAEVESQLNQPDAARREYQELIRKYASGPYATYARAVLAAGQDRAKAGALLDSIGKTAAKKVDPRLRTRIDALRRELKSSG